MFEDILDGFQELEDELEKKPGLGEEDPGNILSLDSNDWDTGESDTWDTGGENEPADKIWGI
jgi:hypothetical protein